MQLISFLFGVFALGYMCERLVRRGLKFSFPVGFELTAVFAVGLLNVAFVVVYAVTGTGIQEGVFYYLVSNRSGQELSPIVGRVLGFMAVVILGVFMAFAVVRFAASRSRVATGSSADKLYWVMACAAVMCSPLVWYPINRFILTAAGSKEVPAGWQQTRATFVPEIKPNLIFLYLESFERTFLDHELFPGLCENIKMIERESWSASNMTQIPSQSYTMAGIVASQTGVHFVAPAPRFGNSMSGTDKFYPGAIGMGRLLSNAGYRCEFIGGANKDFAGKGNFWIQNGYDRVLGSAELLELDPSLRSEGWGVFDDDLFGVARARLSELSRADQPFCITLLTLGTHFPGGHLSPEQRKKIYRNGDNPMLNAVYASDQLIGEFYSFIRSDPDLSSSIIVLVSDHLAMPNTASDSLKNRERRNLFIISDPQGRIKGDYSSPCSHLDVAPTVMRALGFETTMGFGRDVLTTSRTKFEVDQLSSDQWLNSHRAHFLGLWDFPRFEGQIEVDSDRREVAISGRTMQFPVMLGIAKDQRVTPWFATNFDPRVSPFEAAVEEIPENDAFVFVGEPSLLPKGVTVHDIASGGDIIVAWGNNRIGVVGFADARPGRSEIRIPDLFPEP